MADRQASEPSALEGSSPGMSPLELEVTWTRALSVWWAYAWRSFLALPLGAALGCVIGFVVGMVGQAVGAQLRQIQLLTQLLTVPVGVVLALVVGLWAMHHVLRKTFKEFRIALIARSGRTSGR